MRLSNTKLVVLAVVLLASGTTMSKADVTGVSNVNVVPSLLVPTGEERRLLRSHRNMDDEGKLGQDEEERNHDLFSAMKLSNAQTDEIARFLLFGRWMRHGYTAEAVEKHVPESLYKAYIIYRRMNAE
ncbi:Avirulence (Avh) protein [Phytophthora megakarya]|uniref:RxLR effector protein n=1 Tax=Phytophthora megakarya TaxID=4795 RepID=A0A225V8N5_9STRA|nr:Avirulence (Avh) protein [Phytophthora megakarya]